MRSMYSVKQSIQIGPIMLQVGYNSQKMEELPCDSSKSSAKERSGFNATKKIELRQIVPVEVLQKELETETSGIITRQNRIINAKCVYPGGRMGKKALQSLLQLRPIYGFASFLKTIEITDSLASFFKVEKVSSLPSTKYTITGALNSVFELSSNFSGSKYSLKNNGITYLTIKFEVGLGKPFRSFTLFILREPIFWNSLLGSGCTRDLSELYEKGSNYEHIGKYMSLQPTLCPEKHIYTMNFSRQGVISSVQNTIVCNMNGQKVLQLVKTSQKDKLFQLSMDKTIQAQIGIALAIALFDFKLSIQ